MSRAASRLSVIRTKPADVARTATAAGGGSGGGALAQAAGKSAAAGAPKTNRVFIFANIVPIILALRARPRHGTPTPFVQ